MGGPNNTIEFFLNGAPFTASDDSVFAQDGFNSSLIVTINTIDAAMHRGEYTCRVTNMAGMDAANATVIGETNYKMAFIDIIIGIFFIVSPLGIVNIEPMNRTSSRGDNVTFDCQTEAGPGNEYFWFFNTPDPTSLSMNGNPKKLY